MSDHLRYSGLPDDAQRDALEAIIRATPLLMEVLVGLREDGLPDHLLVAGALYNLVWNRLTGRPDLTGINDIDVFYYDASDLGWDAEDVVIKRLARRFAHLPLPVEVRNQARARPIRIALSNSFGFGGHNTILALSRCDLPRSRVHG